MTENGSPVDADKADLTAEDFPLRLRVHALARLLGIASRDVLAHLGEMGVAARTAQSSISRDDAVVVAQRHKGDASSAPAAATSADQPDADQQSADPAAAETTPAPGASLFSAIEVESPAAAGASREATAPLFLAPEATEAAANAPKKAAKKKADDGEQAARDESSDAEKADGKNADGKGKKSDGKKNDKNAEGKKSDGKKNGKKSGKKKADDRGDEATDAAEDVPAVQAVDADSVTAPSGADDAADTDTDSQDDSDGRDDAAGESRSRRRRRGRRGRGRGRGDQAENGDDGDENTDGSDKNPADKDDSVDDASGSDNADDADKNESTADDADSADSAKSDGESNDSDDAAPSSKRRRRRRRRRGSDGADESTQDDPPNTVVHEREPRSKRVRDEVQGISGSTRLEAKRQRRRDGRDAGRRRPPILTESEFLARREAVERVMVVRERGANAAVADGEHAHIEDYTQVAVLEDGVLVEHFVTTETSQSMVGNIYLGRVQNVLPGMEAAFVDVGRGRNGVLYAGEVNWEAAGLDGGSRKIEQALKPGDYVLVQVSKDPIGHKGARLTTQISLAGRYLVYVPGGTSTGISRKLPDTERKRLKQILAKLVPDEAGVIIRTASEGVSAEELASDVQRLEAQWKSIEAAAAEHTAKASGTPRALYEEPDLLVRVVRDLFNEDFRKLVVEGDKAWGLVSGYVGDVAPDLMDRVEQFTKDNPGSPDSFAVHRIDEQLAKALDRKVWLPSGGTLIIEHTEAMTVVDVNTGKFTGSGGNLEETVTRNNLEAAEEIVRQMRLRDIGGMIIVDFIDMVLESNRDLVLRRLTEALARDRTRHQVSEVTSLGLVQMTRKRLGTGLLEAFSTTCTACAGRGVIVHSSPVEVRQSDDSQRGESGGRRSRRKNKRGGNGNGNGNGGSGNENEPQSVEAKASHKPAAEHPMFRAMAHHDDEADAESGAPEAAAAVTEDAEAPKNEAPKAEAPKTEKPKVESRQPRARGTRSDDVESPKTEAAVAAVVVDEPVAETPDQPVAVVRRRRRAVRRPAAPTATAPEPIVVAENTTPVTSVAEQSPEPVVAVKRTPRRRSGRRAAGPPPGDA